MLEKVQADRQVKLDALREMGVEPYGQRFDGVQSAADVLANFSDEQAEADGEEPTQTARIAGRIVLKRDMGKMSFITLRDSSGDIQIALRKNILSETDWAVGKLLDLGDLIGVDGPLKRTRTGEVTIWVDSLTMLCKSMLPMPEKYHGLQDVEQRYRRRYLDLMTNPDALAVFHQRIAMVEQVRLLLKKRGYLEVETPILQPIYGGAAARPFTTHHNTFDFDFYLRISPELYLKRLLVGGMEKVYDINRNFRNEGVDTSHNPEFTMMELYEAYADYNTMADIAEELFTEIAREVSVPALLARRDRTLAEIEQIKTDAERVLKNKRSPLSDEEKQAEHDERMTRYNEQIEAFPQSNVAKAAEACEAGRLTLPYGEHLLEFEKPWRRAKYADLLMTHAGVNMNDIDAVRAKARELKINESKMDDAVAINEVFEATVEEHLVQPTFVMDYPAGICPLTRRDPENEDIALRFELFAAKMELANAYTELNDPVVQAENLQGQLEGEDGETMRVMDEDFVRALMHGMPPAGGMGIGIDRMVMLLTDTPAIRDVILFPTLRPEAQERNDG